MEMRIGYWDSQGTSSEAVAHQLFPRATLRPYPSIEGVFDGVSRGEVLQGVVPLESLVEGPVTETLDSLFEYAGRANIADVLILPIGQDRRQDKTKFAVLGKQYHERTGNDATSLVIYPHRDRIGLLEDILYIISQGYGLNLSSIHSRPDSKGGFRFYMELEGHLEDEAVAVCIQDLGEKLATDEAEVRIFGAYPRRLFNERRIKVIGIIGGTGRMGGWFSKFFQASGYEVLISGRRTSLTYQQCVEGSDAVIVNVPIQHTVEVIQSVGRDCRPGQLIIDNASIKTQPVAAMLESVPEGVEVLGMHTVFGPSIPELRHQNVIFTYTPKSGELSQEFEGIFYKFGARITRTTPQFHDQQMAFHQNLEHFTKIALAEILRERFGGPQDLSCYSSPNSRMSLITMGRILNMDPDLACEIQTFNLQGPMMIGKYLEVVTRLGNTLIQGDMLPLKESIKESVRSLGKEFLGEMMENSQEIENQLGELSRLRRRRNWLRGEGAGKTKGSEEK